MNENKSNNKYVYEKTKEFESADHDHPLKLPTKNEKLEELKPSVSGINLSKDFDSVALDWKSLRNGQECSCSSYFDHSSKKTHCRRCGNIFCIRCINKKTILPGHLEKNYVSVCKPCYEIVNSLDVAE